MNEDLKRLEAKDAWVAYSLPGSLDHVLLIGESMTTLPDRPSFVLQGWDKEHNPRIYLCPDQVLSNGRWSAAIDEECLITSTDREIYENAVKKTVQTIQQGILEKAVISKIKVVERQDEDLYELFVSLKGRYPEAFTFMYYIPGAGLWCGATPEVLIEAKGNNLKTMALAGTLPIREESLDDLPWTAKERHEQGVIEEYVEEAFNELQLKYEKVGPRTIKAGSMAHLQSIYTIPQTKDVMRLIERLHPGPAICGRPQGLARKWIDDQEQHDREHYCGYLGPWEILGQQAIFIHLRSMRIYKNHYVLYLGGGITADSDITAEWDETELKAQTMLSVINNAVHG